MGTSPCEISEESYNSKHKVLKVLGKTVRHNYFLLFMAFVFTLIAILVIIYIVYKIIEAVRIYYRFHVRTERLKFSGDSDDEVYKTMADELDEGNSGPDDEYSAIQSKIAEIKKRYKSYNEEMGSYTRNVLGRNPDELMNEDILAREHDDYKYENDQER